MCRAYKLKWGEGGKKISLRVTFFTATLLSRYPIITQLTLYMFPKEESKQNRQWTYKVVLWGVRVIIFAIFNILLTVHLNIFIY